MQRSSRLHICRRSQDVYVFRKDAMMNYAKALDLTQTYQDSFQKLYDSLRCVEQEQEYVEFIRENKK